MATTIEVNVTQTREEIAEQQIHEQEKQRVFGVVPNYYVTYHQDAVPLNTRQKFQLGWKSTLDPVSFGIAGAIAGVVGRDESCDKVACAVPPRRTRRADFPQRAPQVALV